MNATTIEISPRHAELLAYLVDNEPDAEYTPVIEAGNSGLEGTAPYPTLAAMERRGLVKLERRVQAAVGCPRVTYTVALLTDAGREALAAHRAAQEAVAGPVEEPAVEAAPEDGVAAVRGAMRKVLGRTPLMDEAAGACASVERGDDRGLRAVVDPYGGRRQDGDEEGIARDVESLRRAIEGAPRRARAELLELAPLALRAGRECDPVTIKQQVGPWTWMGMGAKNLIGHPDALQADIFLGAGHTKRRLLVKLMPQDTYSLELGRVRNRGLDFDVIEHVHDVYAEELDRQVRALYDRHAV